MIADLMVYNIEVSTAFTAKKYINQDAFYKSMLKSFEEAVKFIDANGLATPYNPRLEKLIDAVFLQNWVNKSAFEDVMDKRII